MLERHPGIFCSTARGVPYLHITERARVRFRDREAAWWRSAFVSSEMQWLEIQLLRFASGRQATGDRGREMCILYFAAPPTHSSRSRIHRLPVSGAICRHTFVCAPRIKPCGDQTLRQPRCFADESQRQNLTPTRKE